MSCPHCTPRFTLGLCGGHLQITVHKEAALFSLHWLHGNDRPVVINEAITRDQIISLAHLLLRADETLRWPEGA